MPIYFECPWCELGQILDMWLVLRLVPELVVGEPSPLPPSTLSVSLRVEGQDLCA